jgi:hypothetical protein
MTRCVRVVYAGLEEMLQLGAYANLAGLRPCATLEACATRLPPESYPSFFC